MVAVVILFMLPIYLIYPPLSFCKPDSKTKEQVAVNPNEKENEEIEGYLTWHDREREYNLYERNRDEANWDVRENWRKNEQEYFEGTTKIDPNPPSEDNGY